MSKKYLLMIFCCMFLMHVIGVGTCLGGDLDDGISEFKDDPISKDDEMGKGDINIKYIVLSAMTKAKAQKGNTNQNSVVVFGDNRGTIINVGGSKNTEALCDKCGHAPSSMKRIACKPKSCTCHKP